MKNLTVRENSELVLLIDFLDWMNKMANQEPMIFETDHEDIAQIYIMSKRDKYPIFKDEPHGSVSLSELP